MKKIIHYVWLGTAKKGDNFKKCFESWKKFCPDFEIKEWNENNFDFSACKYAKEAYDKKKYAFVSDYIRLKVLQQYGGIYLDTDVEIIRPIDSLLNYLSCLGFENSGYLASNFIVADQNQPWIDEVLQYYENASFVLPSGKLNLLPNTFLITAFLKKYHGLKIKNIHQSLEGNINIFPADYFSPKDLQTQKITLTENTYSIHHFDASWTDKKFTSQQKFLRGIRKLFGKRIFEWFTNIYSKIELKKVAKTIKNVQKNAII